MTPEQFRKNLVKFKELLDSIIEENPGAEEVPEKYQEDIYNFLHGQLFLHLEKPGRGEPSKLETYIYDMQDKQFNKMSEIKELRVKIQNYLVEMSASAPAAERAGGGRKNMKDKQKQKSRKKNRKKRRKKSRKKSRKKRRKKV